MFNVDCVTPQAISMRKNWRLLMPFDLPLKCVLSASCWPLFSAAVIRAAALSLSRQGLNLLTLHKSHVRNIMVLNQFSQQRALSRFFSLAQLWSGYPFPPSDSSTQQFLVSPFIFPRIGERKWRSRIVLGSLTAFFTSSSVAICIGFRGGIFPVLGLKCICNWVRVMS